MIPLGPNMSECSSNVLKAFVEPSEPQLEGCHLPPGAGGLDLVSFESFLDHVEKRFTLVGLVL
jgi:hypothetical protein